MLPDDRLIVCGPDLSLPLALSQAVRAAQAGDPLTPVDVVVPNGLAGVTLRRAAAGPQGWAGVRFGSLPQLVERLTARAIAHDPGPLRMPLTAVDRSRAVGAVLAGAESSPLVDAARRQVATTGLLGRVLAELDDVELASWPNLSARGAEVLALHAAYRAQTAGARTSAELLRLAFEQAANWSIPVVLVASGSFDAAERRLLEALREAGRLHVVLPAAASAATAAWCGRTPTDQLPRASHLLAVPDAEEEVRLAVRTVLAHLAATGCRPERVGIAYAAAVPYSRLLADQLTVAGLPHHVPSQRSLAQTLTGRTLLGLLRLHDRDAPRADLIHWMSDAPVLDAAGRRVRPTRWDQVSRDAGVHRGLATWTSRLTQYAADQRAREALDEQARERHEGRAADAEALLGEVHRLHALADAVLTAATWAEASSALLTLVRGTLGGHRDVDRWGRDLPGTQVALEQRAHDAVLAGLGDLALLDGPPAVQAAVDEVLRAAVPSGTTLGRGVLTGYLRSFAGADLDLLLVLGCTEDALPQRVHESALLRDADRTLLSPELATVASRRRDQRESWVAALGAAPQVRLSYPRADTRSQRRSSPSPWLLEQGRLLDERTDEPPLRAQDLDDDAVRAGWFTFVPSFEASLRGADGYTDAHELDALLALSGQTAVVELADPRFARGLAAARARTAGSFDAWSGATGPLPESLRSRVDTHLSATNLQTWATCPASHLFGKVLGVQSPEDPGGEDVVDPRERGSLVHAVLEDLLADRLEPPGLSPLAAWTQDDVAVALALLTKRAAALTDRGLTGRAVLWEAQLGTLRRTLARLLAHDTALRATRLATPIAVEAAFGRHGVAALAVDLPTQGRVEFAGSIDRIDRTAVGDLVVVDYKTGGDSQYGSIPKQKEASATADLLDSGKKLQLVLYALAARQLQGLPDAAVQSWFWFVEQGDLHRGGPVGEVQEQRLLTVLDTVVAGVRGGVFPAHPGEEAWRTGRPSLQNCSYCAFDRVCPTTRAEQWQGLRTDPAVAAYAELVAGPEPS